jgi:Mg2+ and Co2+ transporter CorA
MGIVKVDIDELTDKITEKITAKFEERFRNIEKQLDSIDRITSNTSDDLKEDRKDLGHIKVNSAGTEQGIKELIDMSAKSSEDIATVVGQQIKSELKHTSDKIAEKVQPTIADGLKKFLKISKNGVELKKKKRFWFF